MCDEDTPQIAAVYNPIIDELFTAAKGKGAWLNGNRIHVSNETQLRKCRAFFIPDFTTKRQKNTAHFRDKLYMQCRRLLDTWSPALDWCLVASGKVDVVLSISGNPIRPDAGTLILEEAGGKVTDFYNKPFNELNNGCIVGSNSLIHDQFLELIREDYYAHDHYTQILVINQTFIETMLLDAVEMLVTAIDSRNCSFNHSVNVASYAVSIAKAIGWQGQVLMEIRLGALLHDIGQIFWSDEILHKSGMPLTTEERKTIESHTYKGADLLKDRASLNFVKPYILYHQEWIDGSGYPFGLKGDQIPTEVQIVSIADVYEALRHPREYKKRSAFSSSQAIEIMGEMKGKRWHCELFDAFVEVASNW